MSTIDEHPIDPDFNRLSVWIHEIAVEKGFWDHADLGSHLERLQRGPSMQGTDNPSIVPEKLMLVVTEVAEAMEAYRNDDHPEFAEELADTIIRILDLCAYLCIDIDRAVITKVLKNRKREHLHGRKR